MKALRITEPGAPDVLRVDDVPVPRVETGETLVAVRAAGINRADIAQRKGIYPAPPGAPSDIPGLEFAGELKSGARVFGLCSGGAQAGYVAIANELLMNIPDGLSDIDAAAIPEAFITAHDALCTQAGLQHGERVLVHAIGSGVGIAALQIAVSMGCEVFGTSRNESKLQRAVSFGLAHGIHTPSQSFAAAIERITNGQGVDVILDFIGRDYAEQNMAALSSRGRMVCLAVLSGAKAQLDLGTLMRKRLRIMGSVLRSRSLREKAAAKRAFEGDFLPKIASGEMRMPIDKVFPLEDAPAAHRYVENNANFGKVVLAL